MRKLSNYEIPRVILIIYLLCKGVHKKKHWFMQAFKFSVKSELGIASTYEIPPL